MGGASFERQTLKPETKSPCCSIKRRGGLKFRHSRMTQGIFSERVQHGECELWCGQQWQTINGLQKLIGHY